MSRPYATLVPLAAATLALAACTSDPHSPAPPNERDARPGPDLALAPGDNVVVVREADVVRQAEGTFASSGWVFFTRTPASAGAFRVGPGTPLRGVGSFEIATPDVADAGFLLNFDHTGTRLVDITALSFATYRVAGSAQHVAVFAVQVVGGGGADEVPTTLVFDPTLNGAVIDGAWQTWDAYQGGNAIWWSTRAIPGVCAASCPVTWNTLLASNPGARITGGVGASQENAGGLTVAVDAVRIGYGGGTLTYDLEPAAAPPPPPPPPTRVPTDKDDCKNDGWRTLTRADGTTFRNQGDCVSYVNTGR